MPIIEYRCPKGHTHESYQPWTPADTHQCPVCAKEAKRIEFSVPARRNPEHGIQN